MNARHRLLIACAVALPTVVALAQQPHIRPGLWEETVQVKSDNAQMNAAMEQMRQRMAAMTPEQRAAMEKAMGGHAAFNPGVQASAQRSPVPGTRVIGARRVD